MCLHPVKDHGVTLCQRSRHSRDKTLVALRLQKYLLIEQCGHLVGILHTNNTHIVTRDIIPRNVCHTAHITFIGKSHHTIQFLEARMIESHHLEGITAGSLVALDKEHLHTVAHLNIEQRGRRA